MNICTRFCVSGRVQGVWYRASAREQAIKLGIDGHARNLPDGRVEILACGDEQNVAALEQWLWIGPSHARVTAVASHPLPYREVRGFSIA